MAWWKFKSCPRCDGDMFIARDQYGWYKDCIQCGYRHDLIDIVELEQQQVRGVKKGRRRVGNPSKGK